MTEETNNKLKQISQSLKSYNPKKVILFGSYAWGKPNKDSDIDILIIKNTKEDWFLRMPKARSYLYHIDGAFDILVMTPSEIKKRLALGDPFIQLIFKKGKILYESKR